MSKKHIMVRPFVFFDIVPLFFTLLACVKLETNQVVWKEIFQYMGYMLGRRDLNGRKRTYLVAVNKWNFPCGCIAYGLVDPKACRDLHFSTEKIWEIFNFFVLWKRHGIGSVLFHSVCVLAEQYKMDCILAITGPRYFRFRGYYDNPKNGFEKLSPLLGYFTHPVTGESRIGDRYLFVLRND